MSQTAVVTPSARLPAALVAWSAVLAVFLLVPPFLKASVGPPAGFTLQEAADLLTPLVVIPMAWLVLELEGGLCRWGSLAFLVAAAAWVEGQGIHLAANAIGDAFPPGGAEAFYATVPGELGHWLDEVLSHWLWHGAWVVLAALMMLVATRSGAALPSVNPVAAFAGLVHGTTFFTVTIEGATPAIGIPASAGLAGWAACFWWRRNGHHPVVTFFAFSAGMTLLACLAWAAMNGWTLPEFSEVGLLG